MPDDFDDFPEDPDETQDSDGDGVGDNADPAPNNPDVPSSSPEIIISNLALGQPTSQITTGFGGVSSRAVDGDTNGNYSAGSVTHTSGNDNQPWWQVDLGQQSDIQNIEIWNRTNGNLGNRLSDFTLFVSDEDPSERSLADLLSDSTVSSFPFEGTPGETTTIQANVTGRFIRIQLPGSANALSLAEVIVNGSASVKSPEIIISNLALGQPTSQITTGFGGVSSRAVDGDTNGNYSAGSVTHTSGNDNQPWWQVDLGQQSDIQNIEIWNRTNGNLGNRLSDFTLFVSDEDPSERSLADLLSDSTVSSFPFEGTPGETTTIQANVTGRFIRIQLPGSANALSLAEVIVNGSASVNPPVTPDS